MQLGFLCTHSWTVLVTRHGDFQRHVQVTKLWELCSGIERNWMTIKTVMSDDDILSVGSLYIGAFFLSSVELRIYIHNLRIFLPGRRHVT